MFLDYVNHKEEKYDGDIGTLSRKKIVIDNVTYIGKESNNLEESEILGVSDEDYVKYESKDGIKDTIQLKEIILKMRTKEARRIGLSKRHLFRLKKGLKKGHKIALRKGTMRKLLSCS